MASGGSQHADHEPYCLAMVLCDHVHRDPGTLKFTILGTFHAVRAASFPSAIQLTVYFAITDTIGSHEIRVQMVDASAHLSGDNVEPIFSHVSELEVRDPMAVVEGVITAKFNIPAAGVYHVELYAGKTPLMSRRLVAIGPQGAK